MATISHGTRLKNLREAAGLSGRELARQINVSHSTIIFWEKGDSIPRSEVLLPMSQALGVSLEILLGAKQAPKKASGGKLGEVFQQVSDLPRRRQQSVIKVVEALVKQNLDELAAS